MISNRANFKIYKCFLLMVCAMCIHCAQTDALSTPPWTNTRRSGFPAGQKLTKIETEVETFIQNYDTKEMITKNTNKDSNSVSGLTLIEEKEEAEKTAALERELLSFIDQETAKEITPLNAKQFRARLSSLFSPLSSSPPLPSATSATPQIVTELDDGLGVKVKGVQVTPSSQSLSTSSRKIQTVTGLEEDPSVKVKEGEATPSFLPLDPHLVLIIGGAAAALLILLLVVVVCVVYVRPSKSRQKSKGVSFSQNRIYKGQLLRPSQKSIDTFTFGSPLPTVSEMVKNYECDV